MQIGELCKKADVSKELVRHYESLGLIVSGTTQAGSRTYRSFSPDSIERLRLIKKGKAIGLSLKQIQPLLDAFLNQKMSDKEAIDILTQQSQYIDSVIERANEMKSLISIHLSKVKSNKAGSCKSLDLLKYTQN